MLTEATFIAFEAGGYPGAPGTLLYLGHTNGRDRYRREIRSELDAILTTPPPASPSSLFLFHQESGLLSRSLDGRRSLPGFMLRFVKGERERAERGVGEFKPPADPLSLRISIPPSSIQGGVIYLQMWALGTYLFFFVHMSFRRRI